MLMVTYGTCSYMLYTMHILMTLSLRHVPSLGSVTGKMRGRKRKVVSSFSSIHLCHALAERDEPVAAPAFPYTLLRLLWPPRSKPMAPETTAPARREIYEGSFSGAQERPWIPALRSDPISYKPLPHSLVEFRELEGRQRRKERLRDLWKRLPTAPLLLADHEHHENPKAGKSKSGEPLTLARAKELEKDYERELMGRCHGNMGSLRKHIGWKEFKRYAEAKEVGTFPLSSCGPKFVLSL